MILKQGDQAIVAGFVPKDADLRYTTTGKQVCNFSVKVGDKVLEDGTKIAQWMNCVAWEDVADVAKYLTKFDKVICYGELKQRSYTSREGEEKTVTELNCEIVLTGCSSIAIPTSAPPRAASSASAPPAFDEIEDVSDDDLPF